MARKTTAPADQDAMPALDTSETIDTAAMIEPEPAPPKRVRVYNTRPSNGTVGAIANPLAADIDAWLAAGWKAA